MSPVTVPVKPATAAAAPHVDCCGGGDEEVYIEPKKKQQAAPARASRKIGSDDAVAVLKTITDIVSALINAFEKNEKINLTRVLVNQHL